jgi:hypothetical protein
MRKTIPQSIADNYIAVEGGGFSNIYQRFGILILEVLSPGSDVIEYDDEEKLLEFILKYS